MDYKKIVDWPGCETTNKYEHPQVSMSGIAHETYFLPRDVEEKAK